MKLVVDANILFSLAKAGSSASDLLSTHTLWLLSPDYAGYELQQHRNELEELSGKPFAIAIQDINKKVVFVDISVYKLRLKEAQKLLNDPKDTAYLALAIEMSLPIWSNDRHLKEQSIVEVFTTKDLVILLSGKK